MGSCIGIEFIITDPRLHQKLYLAEILHSSIYPVVLCNAVKVYAMFNFCHLTNANC